MEAQLGALRDIDFGIFPYTSSSSTIAAYAPIGAGIPAWKLDGTTGIMKAYSSCVGEGPFTCEFFGEEADRLREAGHAVAAGHLVEAAHPPGPAGSRAVLAAGLPEGGRLRHGGQPLRRGHAGGHGEDRKSVV